MKILLYVLAGLTWMVSLVAFADVGNSALRAGLAATLWVATLVGLGAAAICDRLDTISAQLKAAAKPPTPPPLPKPPV